MRLSQCEQQKDFKILHGCTRNGADVATAFVKFIEVYIFYSKFMDYMIVNSILLHFIFKKQVWVFELK